MHTLNAYTSHNSFVGSAIAWIPLLRQHATELSGHCYAMIRGFLFLEQPNQTLAAVDIHRYVGDIHVHVRHTNGSNYLKGRAKDTHHALLAGMGFNLMLLLREWAGYFLAIMLWTFFSLIPSRPLRLAKNYAGP
jgi:hypothetical protein